MRIVLGSYSQLSAGTPAPILERALAEAYKPILTYLYKHPQVNMHLYLSGWTYEWFETNHPEVNMLIADLCKKDQLELLTGGFNQPVFQIISGKDRSTQIEEMTTFIRKRFAKRPRTAWIYNQIWNPSLISALDTCSVERVLISTTERLSEVQGAIEPFVMQEMGKTIEIFPTFEPVNKLVFQLAGGALTYRQFSESLSKISCTPPSDVCTIMINLDQLLEAQSFNASMPSVLDVFVQIAEHLSSDGSQTILLGSGASSPCPYRGYLAAGWYGNDSSIVDIGTFNQMFIKYPELNQLYGKLLYVTDLKRLYRKNKESKKRIGLLLEKAMIGSPFILDSTGGCYRSSYRKYIHRYLNETERLLAVHEDVPYPRIVDIDFDGYQEHVRVGKNISTVMHPKGATLSDINHLVTGWNYGDTFTGYSHEVDRVSMHSIPDGSAQRSFNDIFLMLNAKLDQYGKYNQKMCFDTSETEYSIRECDKSGLETLCEATFEKLPFSLGDLIVRKRYKFRLHTIVVEYEISNIGTQRSIGMFASELNLSIGTKSDSANLYTVESNKNRQLPPGKAVIPQLKNVRIVDEINKTYLALASDIRFTLVKEDFGVKLATLSGIEVLYQYTQVMPVWEIDIAPQKTFSCTLAFRIERRIRPATSKEST